jgi:hypothetical protein
MRLVPAILLLSACTSVVPGTAARLSALDPLTADPAAIEVAVILPPGLAITPGTAMLQVGATRGEESLTGSFALRDRPAATGPTAPEGAVARVFSLTDTDAQRMRDLQTQISDWQQEGRAQGSLGLAVGGCAIGPGPAPDARGSVYIRLAADASFLPLIQDGRLDDLLGADVLAAIKPCKGAS